MIIADLAKGHNSAQSANSAVELMGLLIHSFRPVHLPSYHNEWNVAYDISHWFIGPVPSWNVADVDVTYPVI